MDSELKFDLLEVMVKHNVLPENYVRNERIRMEYIGLIKSGISKRIARETLAEKYFTSLKNIEKILYGKFK